MEVVQVQPRDSYLHYIYVGTQGTAIRWSFTTKRKNIAFGLYRRLGPARLPSSSEFIFQQQEQQQRRTSIGEVFAASYDHGNSDNWLLLNCFVKHQYLSYFRKAEFSGTSSSTAYKEQWDSADQKRKACLDQIKGAGGFN